VAQAASQLGARVDGSGRARSFPISRLCVLVKINRLAERQLRVQTLQGDGGPSKALDQGALDGGT
jgi:hypothetical protein